MSYSLQPRGGEISSQSRSSGPEDVGGSASRLMRDFQNSDSHEGREALTAGIVCSIICAIILIILITVVGLSWWWIFVSALPILSASRSTALSVELDDRDYAISFESPTWINLLGTQFRAQDAIRTALRSALCRQFVGRRREGVKTDGHEWELALLCEKSVGYVLSMRPVRG